MWKIWTGSQFICYLARICTLSTKLRNFQFKFLHRRIATNSFLFKIKLSESNLCCFCQSAQETLLHLFWECPITEAFWNSVQQFFVSVDLIPASQALTLCQCLQYRSNVSYHFPERRVSFHSSHFRFSRVHCKYQCFALW